MPTPLLTRAVKGLSGQVDRAFVSGAITPTRRARRSGAEALTHTQRMQSLAVLEAFYGDPRWLARDSGFFATPEPIAPRARRIRRLGPSGELVELSWRSAFEPLFSNPRARALLAQLPSDVPVGTAHLTPAELIRVLDQIGPLARVDFSQRYLAHRDNHTAVARHYRHHDGPRPTIVLLHGFMGGYFPLEQRVLLADRFFAGGMDVVLSTLPLHGARRDRTRGLRPPRFPGSDPRYTVEGFRQAVYDQQALLSYLADGQNTPLGLSGMSLGGYTAALMATLDERLSFALLRVPLGCIADFALRTGRMVGSPGEQEAQATALRRVHAPVSPLARTPTLAGERIHVVTGAADQVTGPCQSARLVQHFGAHESAFEGGHVLQYDYARALKPFFAMLQRLGHWDGPGTT